MHQVYGEKEPITGEINDSWFRGTRFLNGKECFYDDGIAEFKWAKANQAKCQEQRLTTQMTL